MQPNEDLFRREYDAFARDDVASLDGIFADDIVYHVPGHNPFSGDYRGKEAVFELFRQDRRASFRSEIHDILANDRRAVALTVVQGARQGGSSRTSRFTSCTSSTGRSRRRGSSPETRRRATRSGLERAQSSTYVSQWAYFSVSPLVAAKKAPWSSLVTGPRCPSPTTRSSTSRIGVSSAAVPVKKHSSAL
jgi:uncharacterized protein